MKNEQVQNHILLTRMQATQLNLIYWEMKRTNSQLSFKLAKSNSLQKRALPSNPY